MGKNRKIIDVPIYDIVLCGCAAAPGDVRPSMLLSTAQ